jgi:LysR family transcriptional regulator, positive regulator for ilvC
MDLAQLRFFVHLAKSLHFGKTAQQCHVSPSALSRSIQRLEEELGVALFVRDRRSVALTEEGRAAHAFAVRTLEDHEALGQRLAHSQERLTGSVSIFASVTACQSFLPPLLSEFRRAHPEVKIHLETGYALDALERLTSGTTDVAVAALPDEVPATLTARVVVRIPLVFVAPAEACAVRELCRREAIPWGEVPMVMPAAGIAREAVDAWLAKRRVAPLVYEEVAGNEAILSLVSLGCGVGIVPKLVADQSALNSAFAVLEIEPKLPPLRVGVCTQKKRLKAPIVRALWESIVPRTS